MPNNTPLPTLTGGQLAGAAYGPTTATLPSGWYLANTFTSSTGATSVSVFYNPTTNQVVESFRGTSNPENATSDVEDGGSSAWLDITGGQAGIVGGAVAAANSYINDTFPSYDIFSVGDSLGGGMAQANGLIYQTSVAGYESLPISQAALDEVSNLYGSVSQAITQWSNSGAAYESVYQQGDPATATFSSGVLGSNGPITSSTYLPAFNTVVLDNPYASIEQSALGSEVAFLASGDLVGAAFEALIVADAAYQSHWIANTVYDLQNGDGYTQSATTPPPNSSINANAALLNNNVSDSTVNPPAPAPGAAPQDASVTATGPQGGPLSIGVEQTNVDGTTYDINNDGTVAQAYVNIGVTGSSFNASSLGVQNLSDLVGGNTLTTGGAAGVTLTAYNNDVLYGNNDGSTMVIAGTGISAYASAENIIAATDSSFNIEGSGYSQIQAGAGAYVGIVGDKNDSVTMNNGTLASALEATANLNGSSNTVNWSDGGYLGITGGINNSVTTANSTLATLGNISFNLAGGNDNVGLGSGQSGAYIGLIGSSGYNVNASTTGETIAFAANTSGQVDGSAASIQIDGNADAATLLAGSDQIGIAANEINEIITASDATFNIGSGVSVTVDGSHDVFNGGDGDVFHIDGSDNTAYATNSTIDFSGSGDYYDGSGDSGSGGDNGGGDGNYGGYGYYGGYAFSSKSAATGTNIGKIASYDASLTDQAAAVSAETAKLEAADAANATAAPLPQFEGPKWSSDTITWSLATSPGNMGTPFSGYLGSQYESTVEQAFQTWAAASGLKFEEVADSAQSDIRIGWSTFNAASSGVLGYTSLKSLNGSMEAGVAISLEDPTEDALTTDANGQLAYSGSNVELSQLLLHEIGHALGLADNADTSSVMSAVLSSSNQTLDATDIAGIADLYPVGGAVSSAASAATSLVGVKSLATTALSASATSSLSAYTAQAAQLIESMASFSSASSSSALITLPPTMGSSLSSAMALAVAA